MKHILTVILLIFTALLAPLSGINSNIAWANTPLKITGLSFDNSDNIILINSQGQIKLPSPKINTPAAPKTVENKTDGAPLPDTAQINKEETAQNEEKIDYSQNIITKGFLKEPDRAYIDITNAVLSGSAKSYELKNSIFKTVKISQFSVNPNVVRLVFTYASENSAQTGNFNALANDKSIIIKYSKPLGQAINKTAKEQIIYSDTEDKSRLIFFEGSTSSLISNYVVPVNNATQKDNKSELNNIFEKNNENLNSKEYKLQSKYFIDSISKSQKGLMIKGMGFLSLKPAFYLENPDRIVVDFDDTVVSKNLRGKSINIDENGSDIIKLGQNSTNVARLVIEGPQAKNYRLVISPDFQNVFIAKKTDIINSKITETQTSLKSTKKNDETIQKINEKESLIKTTMEFNFTAPVAFSVFQENDSLYLDFNNASQALPNVLDALKTQYENVQIIKLALDKLRIVLPAKTAQNVQLKASPDAKTILAIIKHIEEIKEENKEGENPEGKREQTISKAEKKEPSISNLYKVVIDAGHGGSDVGATRNGIYEKNITLSIAKMVEKNLQAKKVKTTMTLDKDKTVSLQERCDISNEVSPDLFVSIHVNSSVNNAIYGVETHWWKQDSVEYAQTVHSSLAKNFGKWGTRDRGLFKSQFYVINHTEAPAILVEIGFISNANEREAIITQKRQTEIAKAITEGIMNYLKNRGQEEK